MTSMRRLELYSVNICPLEGRLEFPHLSADLSCVPGPRWAQA